MRRYSWFAMLLVLVLAACAPSSSNLQCIEGVCVGVTVEGPVEALEPALVVISVKTDKDISGLTVGLSGNPTVAVHGVGETPDGAELVYQDETHLGWRIDTRGGEEYTFSGRVVLAKPTVSYGIFSYKVDAYASKPTIPRVTDSIRIYLDAEGRQIEESRVQMLLQTEIPPAAPLPDETVVQETETPTVEWPTATPVPSPSPTPPPYPPPDTPVGADVVEDYPPPASTPTPDAAPE